MGHFREVKGVLKAGKSWAKKCIWLLIIQRWRDAVLHFHGGRVSLVEITNLKYVSVSDATITQSV